MKTIKGKVWKFGNDINTDLITPGPYLTGTLDQIKVHALEAVNPRFAKEVHKGDVIVAGRNFGCGSSREVAPLALQALGIVAVVAESFARIFFRNAVAIGLGVLACPSVSQSFEEGDTLELDLENARVNNPGKGTSLKGAPLPQEMLGVLKEGGITPLLKQMFGRGER